MVKEDDFNQVFVRVEEIRAAKKSFSAKIAVHQRMADGRVKEKAYLFKPNECLAAKAGRSEYDSFVISEINPGTGTVEFANGVRLREGQAQGADEAAVFREQIRYTVEQHLRRQEQLREAGYKVLSLFFIDRVENYTGDEPLSAGCSTRPSTTSRASSRRRPSASPRRCAGPTSPRRSAKGGRSSSRTRPPGTMPRTGPPTPSSCT